MALKVQTHNLIAKTHTVKAGTFPVQTYSEHPYGLYVERDFVGHPLHKHWQAHILPEFHWQVCRFTPHSGQPLWDYYIDMVQVEISGKIWKVQDLYLDLTLKDGRLSILDTDELFAALKENHIGLQEAALASESLHRLINLLEQHDHQLEAALASLGLHLEWNGSAKLTSSER